ncbi:MAG: hypothetical protein E7015_00010 [Alphaproteobacteria bacterium]|nr:hypothetical protein [Alphaproteobacteria bacterium]
MKFSKARSCKKPSKGAVLIEFAFGVQLLFLFLLFIFDAPLMYRIHTRLQKMSELTAQMILNIHGSNIDFLTKEDIVDIVKASSIALINKKKSSMYPFVLSTNIYCLKGNSVQWTISVQYDVLTDSASLTEYVSNKSVLPSVFNLQNESISVKNKEIKLCIETIAWSGSTFKRPFISGIYQKLFSNSGKMSKIAGSCAVISLSHVPINLVRKVEDDRQLETKQLIKDVNEKSTPL